ncbi:MAG: amidohydrolase family protein [Bacteroidia bacterium]
MQITNCHTHIFTNKIIPDNFLIWPLQMLANIFTQDSSANFLLSSTRKFKDVNYLLYKYITFAKTGGKSSQEEVFNHLQNFYPEGTKFVVLSMDMEFMEAGSVKMKFEEQLNELADLKKKYGDIIHPFVFAHPERTGITDLVKKYIEVHNFSGIKLYPPLGYFPFDERLEGVYEYAEKNSIPLISHCSRGGVFYKGKITDEMRKHPKTGIVNTEKHKSNFTDFYTDPKNYEYVFEKFPNLKLCLAHFGGDTEWNKYLDGSWDLTKENDWFFTIRNMMVKYPSLYTDISYTHSYSRFLPLLKVTLQSNPELAKRILFGTDFYMTEQEGSEREHSIRLRAFLGEELFSLIAEQNPKTFL